MATKQIAVQLYTLRNETAEDFPAVLRQVAEAGVSGVEFAGLGKHTAAELRSVLDEVGLVAAGAHIGFGLLENNIDQVIEDVQTLGAKHLTCPGIPAELRPTTADDFRRLGERLARFGERTKAAGLQLSYHNHDWEFAQFDGQYGLDLLFEAADPELLKVQPDLGWVAFAGVDPVAYLKRYAGRTPTVHFKDMVIGPPRYDVPNGEGILPIPELVKVGLAGGTEWFIAELDLPKEPPIVTVQRSAAYLRSLGLA
jgi:sugar phosphate isomerase/epimerase